MRMNRLFFRHRHKLLHHNIPAKKISHRDTSKEVDVLCIKKLLLLLQRAFFCHLIRLIRDENLISTPLGLPVDPLVNMQYAILSKLQLR
jgi:hypothetical protein